CLNVFIPTEISRPRKPGCAHCRPCLVRFGQSSDLLRQGLGRKARKIKSSLSANLAMHREIGRYYWKAACHRLHQGMSKCLGIGGGRIHLAAAVELMQRRVGNRTKLNHFIAEFEITD